MHTTHAHTRDSEFERRFASTGTSRHRDGGDTISGGQKLTLRSAAWRSQQTQIKKNTTKHQSTHGWEGRMPCGLTEHYPLRNRALGLHSLSAPHSGVVNVCRSPPSHRVRQIRRGQTACPWAWTWPHRPLSPAPAAACSSSPAPSSASPRAPSSWPWNCRQRPRAQT